jgi:hypothetical protein
MRRLPQFVHKISWYAPYYHISLCVGKGNCSHRRILKFIEYLFITYSIYDTDCLWCSLGQSKMQMRRNCNSGAKTPSRFAVVLHNKTYLVKTCSNLYILYIICIAIQPGVQICLNEVYWLSILKIIQSFVLLRYIYMPCTLWYVLKYFEILSTNLWIIFKILNQYTSFKHIWTPGCIAIQII